MPVSRSFRAGFAGSAALAVGLFLGGCDSSYVQPAGPGSRGPIGASDLEGSSDFDRDLIAAKRNNAVAAERYRAIEAVLSRYGIPHTASAPSEPLPGPVTAAPAPAAKSAVTSFSTVVRSLSAGNDIHTFWKTISVGPGQSLGATAIGRDGADPFLVAYYRDDPSHSDAYQIKVVAYNDDVTSSNRNSLMTWTNTGTTSRTLTVVAFNYLPSTRGAVDINLGAGGSSTAYPSRFLGGAVAYGGTPNPAVPAGCSPFFTRLIETNRFGGGNAAAVMVVDTKAMRGGIIWDDPSLGTQTLDLLPMLDTAYPSFALLFEATSAKAGSWTEVPAGYSFKQEEFYRCR